MVKTNNKMKKLLIIIMVVFVILGIGGFVFVKEGKKANTDTNDIQLFEKDGKLYFTDSIDTNIIFRYDPQNGKTEKQPYEKNKYEDSEYKLVLDNTTFKSVNKASGEEYCIFDIKKIKEEDGYAEGYGVTSFSISNVYEYNGKLYFEYTESIRLKIGSDDKKYFYSYDPSAKSLEKINLVNKAGNFTINDKYLYYVGESDDAKFINRLELDNMQQITLVNYPLKDYPNMRIDTFSYCERGLYYRTYNSMKANGFSLCLLDTETGELKSMDFEESGICFTYNKIDGCFYAINYENRAYSKVYKINNDFDGKEMLLEKIEMPFKPEDCRVTFPVALGDKIYFAAYSGWKNYDSYAVYGVSYDGEVVLIKKKETSFLRKIFSVRDTKLVKLKQH